MPRPGPRRDVVNVRLSAEEIEWLDAEAARRQVNRSEVIRTAITAARARSGRKTGRKILESDLSSPDQVSGNT